MKHREYRLITKRPILESAGYATKAVHLAVGDELRVDESTYNQLKRGETVERLTGEGIIEFTKYDFENEVQVTTVTVEHGISKLGQRKNQEKPKDMTRKQILKAARKLSAKDFLALMERKKVETDILDQDNILDPNEGYLNVVVEGLDDGEALLFFDGEFC